MNEILTVALCVISGFVLGLTAAAAGLRYGGWRS